jgi:hypothetical protein
MITDDKAQYCCSCNKRTLLWEYLLLEDSKFDFETAYILKSKWCEKHGLEYSTALLKKKPNIDVMQIADIIKAYSQAKASEEVNENRQFCQTLLGQRNV